jgi:hypothetical protein
MYSILSRVHIEYETSSMTCPQIISSSSGCHPNLLTFDPTILGITR